MGVELLLDHWEVALLLGTWSVIGVVALRRRYDWREQRYTQQVNFALNIPIEEDGATILLLRTLLEDMKAHPPAVIVPAHGAIMEGDDLADKTYKLLEAAI